MKCDLTKFLRFASVRTFALDTPSATSKCDQLTNAAQRCDWADQHSESHKKVKK
jgi:hypothetical protein